MKRLSLPTVAYVMEFGLLPLLLLMFVASGLGSRFVYAPVFGKDGLTNIWFIQEQAKFFAARGVELSLVKADLQTFGLIGWISIPIVLLRLITAPGMLADLYASATAGGRSLAPGSPGKALAGFILAGPGALWASTHFSTDSVTLLVYLLNHAPRALVWLQAFLFLGSLILSIEGIVWLMVWAWSRRLDQSKQPRE